MTRLLILLLFVFLPRLAAAQETAPAVLVADEVVLTRDKVLIATGNVQVFQGDVGLTASRITYDQRGDLLQIDGPIRMQDGPDTVVLASAAELDRRLYRGILQSARMVIDQQLQLAAVQINRVDARYSQLYKTAVTSCRVCNDGRPPLWQIRARRVVHDREEKQLYFDGAQFLVGDVPILYFPRLRLPDPTLKRATGFLIPSIRSTSQLATGIKVPYFIRLGDHRDLTLTPYLSSKTRTLELRYRQAFRRGRITLEGAVSRDELRRSENRSYFFGNGAFDLRDGFKLTFDIETTSDDAYLRQYSYSGKDRLDSEIAVSRTRRDEFIQARAIHYQSLRTAEDNSLLPGNVIDTRYERRFFPAAFGGEIRLTLEGHAHRRKSTLDTLGRDVSRLHAGLHWQDTWTLAGGLRAQTRLGVVADAFRIAQDSSYPETSQQVIPQASLTLRYPMRQVSATGVRQFLEPVVQLAWSGDARVHVPNDESTLVEFDEGNLLSLSRFPAADRREYGSAVALGLNWARYDPAGWEAHVSIGQILRDDSIGDFSATSGLGGTTSDFLLAGQIRTADGLALGGRFVFDESLDFAKAEMRGDWESDRVTLGGSYLWLTKDAAEGRTKAVSELTLDGDYRVDKHWTLNGKWRYDAADDRTARAGLGINYDNECVSVGLSAERRFSSSTSVEPETKFGFTIALKGFSARTGTERHRRSCNTQVN